LTAPQALDADIAGLTGLALPERSATPRPGIR